MSSLISLSVQDQDPDPSSCPLPSVLSPSLRLIRDATESVVQGQPWPLLHFRSGNASKHSLWKKTSSTIM
uniref:Uncharacterized protein n=1 Tax=Cannabis sativa TaxID=3483 RepID=A0A803QZ33_CANSA